MPVICSNYHRLDEYGIVINPDKCTFETVKIDCLGHRIMCDSHCIQPLNDKVHVVLNFPLSVNKQKLWQFLGPANFHHHLIAACVCTMKPLTEY